jgi:hypothetical protein
VPAPLRPLAHSGGSYKIQDFLVKTKFKITRPTKFVEVQNIVKIVKKENRPVFTKITRVPFPSQKLLWDLLQASMQWAPPSVEHTAAARPNRLPLCHHL